MFFLLKQFKLNYIIEDERLEREKERGERRNEIMMMRWPSTNKLVNENRNEREGERNFFNFSSFLGKI